MHTRVGVFVVAYDALLSINSLHDVHILVCTRYVQAAFSIYGPGIPRSQIWPLTYRPSQGKFIANENMEMHGSGNCCRSLKKVGYHDCR